MVIKVEDNDSYANSVIVHPAMAPGTGQHTISMMKVVNRDAGVFCGVVREGAECNKFHGSSDSNMG
jgi:hypothetical protein